MNRYVLTAERVAEVFGVCSAIVAHPLTGRPHFVTAPGGNNAHARVQDSMPSSTTPT